ncbi:nucleotide sugar dehydrogenase [Chamaesiphon sp. VAR_48_metabat_135_sub]|uniref:nucleotide sugar dehydrogenase n=1 Tax=Chamaesiphon sp. VAR_48_metabat_135_sub TaxID=2964699 RepID=UPI00286B28BE|nr:nucleotide sugar dehydrogenase [Chamaesiphon sp. VAR_48_metabat_135_sub]
MEKTLNSVKSTLLTKIVDKTAIIGVVGLGYVGLPFAVEKCKVGFTVVGIEQSPKRANAVNAGENYIGDVDDDRLKEIVSSGKLRAVTNFDCVSELDALVICVPTPLTKNLTPDLSYVKSVTEQIAKHLRPGQLITLESTTYPGTTDDLMRPILEETSGLKQGVDFFLAHSPERVDPGNVRYSTKNTNKVVGASDPDSLEVSTLFYQQTIDHVVPVSSAKAAELVKVFENTFRAVNIALVNELALLCDRMEIDVWEVLDAANTKPFGIMPFYPGPGVGGHCIPLDPHYLEWKAKEYNFNTRFIRLAGEINRSMPEFVVQKANKIANQQGIAMSRAKILCLGVAYKKDIDDWRESPAIEVMKLLKEQGSTLSYYDPYVPQITLNGHPFTSAPDLTAAVTESDLVLITTEHSNIDYQLAIDLAKAVLDTRGITRRLKDSEGKVTLL